MKHNVVFRLDFSGKYGYGHLTRCITILENLKTNKVNFFFIILSSDFNNKFLKIIKHHKIYKLKYDSNNYHQNLRKDLIFTSKVLKQINNPIVIVDSYKINQYWSKYISNFSKKLILFNDVIQSKIYCDILIDPTFNRKSSEYKNYIIKKTLIFAGHQYALLRNQFNANLFHKKNQRNILISMGGTDPKKITSKIIKLVLEVFKNDPVIIVLNKSSIQIPILKKKYNSLLLRKKITILSDIYNIMPIYQKTSFCIGAGGVSALERCKIGIPSLVYQAAKNQSNIIYNMKKNKLICVWNNNKELNHLLHKIKGKNSILKTLKKNCLNSKIGTKTNIIYKSILQ